MRKTFGFVLALALLCLPSAVQAQTNGFGYDILGVGGLYTHSANDPVLDWTFIGPPVPGPEVEYDAICLDSDSMGTLYTVDLTFNNLGTLDPVTAQFTTIAPLSGDTPPFIVALCIDESTDIGYGSDGTGLWEINLATGVCTAIAAQFTSTGIGGTQVTSVFELATDSVGNFWCFDVDTDNLWSLNITNGDCTFLGTYTGPPGNTGPQFSNNGMDWDPVSGRLLADVYTGGGTGSYGTWDTTTGVFTEILNHAAFPAPATGAHGGPMCCIGGTTFQIDFWNDAYQTYDTDPVANLVTIPQPLAPPQPGVFAMEFDGNGILQAIDVDTLSVGTLDEATGDFTSTAALIGDFAGTPVGMAYDSSTDTMFLASVGQVFTLDVTNGDTVLVATLAAAVGSTPLSVPVEIAVNSAGDMFMFDSGTDVLYTVDLVTGECTDLGTLPFDAGNFIQGLNFDPMTDTLYGAHIDAVGTADAYGTWDTTTGAFTQIALITDLPADPDGYQLKFAYKGAPAIVDLVPDSFNLVNGVLDSVDPLAELSMSDNDDLRASRDQFAIGARVIYEVGVTAPSDTASAMDLTIEESIFARGAVNRTIQLFNFDTAAFETVDAQLANQGFGDRTDVISVTGDPSRFIEAGTGAVLARVRYDGPVPRAAFTCNVDNIFFTITN